MNKEELKELLAHAIVDMEFTEGPVSRVKSELVNKVIDVVDKWYQEPVKPVLPKGVADEMEEYKTTGFDLIDYFSAINECADDVKNSSKYVYDNTDEINDQRVTNLANAWNNGYTIEKPKLYNLVFGFDSNDHRSAFYKGFRGIIINTDTSIGDLDDLHYQFTQEQIDKYNDDFWIKGVDLNDYKVEVEE